MFEYKAFANSGGMTEKAVLAAQTEAREQARGFANQLEDAQVIDITESSLVLPLTNRSLCVVTVWYQRD